MDNRPIGVFDSGLGGLTAVKQLEKLLDGCDTVFYDTTIHNFVYYFGVNYYAPAV